MSLEATLATLRPKVGEVVHTGEWVEITQSRIDAFAAATGDFQWIHTDPERAARESPWGRTVAHGYLTLALIPLLRGVAARDEPPYPGVRRMVNYGLNKVRFMNAVREGARVRARSKLVAVTEIRGVLQVTEEVTVEIEGEVRPACVAEAIGRFFF